MKIDVETMEFQTYERSKWWASMLKKYEEYVDKKEIALDDLEELYKSEDESNMPGMEQAIESDVMGDIKNTTKSKSRSELTQMLSSGANQHDEGDMLEILYQTMPVIAEHERRFKEAGLDRILNTFDVQKIEDQVGGWLRRKNSVYAGKSLEHSTVKTPPTKCSKRPKIAPLYLECDSVSEAESLHSVDTARYIRASRKHISAAKRTSTSTIKMYRTLPRKRDELRAKYGYSEYEDELELRRHMQALRHRRRQQLGELTHYQSTRHYAYDASFSYSSPHRRKQLRKRRAHSPLFEFTSSDEECGRYVSRCEYLASSSCRRQYETCGSGTPLCKQQLGRQACKVDPDQRSRRLES